MDKKPFRGDELVSLSNPLGSVGAGLGCGPEIMLGILLWLGLLLALENCEIKVKIVSEPTKAEDKKKD